MSTDARYMTVRMVARDPKTAFGTDVLGLYEHPDGAGRSVVLDIAHRFTEQDRALGQDGYSFSLESGATEYAPIERCLVSNRSLHFQLKRESAARLALPESLDLNLELDAAAHRRLVDGLRAILGGGRRPVAVDVSQSP